MRTAVMPPPTVGDYAVLLCSQTELDLRHTLASGQAFRWQRDQDGWWSANVAPEPHPTVLRCWQDREQIYYQTYPDRDQLTTLREYFQLDVDLAHLSAVWQRAAGDEIREALSHFSGLRVAMQDPIECLFSYLCSSVAPIYRIRRGIDSMCRTLGARIGEIGGREFYSFPRLEYMADASREIYDKMGLGFRGANVRETAKTLIQLGGRDYLAGLREASYGDAKLALMDLPGVGAKIADCVCLFSLGKHEAVPLDVHMTRVAKRILPQTRNIKTLSGKGYNEIADGLREKFGPHAGWAQQYLFCNELLGTGAWNDEMGTHVPAMKRLR